jgi:hypothetical protein
MLDRLVLLLDKAKHKPCWLFCCYYVNGNLLNYLEYMRVACIDDQEFLIAPRLLRPWCNRIKSPESSLKPASTLSLSHCPRTLKILKESTRYSIMFTPLTSFYKMNTVQRTMDVAKFCDSYTVAADIPSQLEC